MGTQSTLHDAIQGVHVWQRHWSAWLGGRRLDVEPARVGRHCTHIVEGRIGKQYVLVLWPAIPLLGCAWGLAAWVPFVSVWYSVAGSTLTIIAITWAFWLEPRLWELFRQGVGRVRSFVF